LKKIKLLLFGKWLLITFLFLLICFDIYLAINGSEKFYYQKTILLIIFIAIFTFRNKFTWILGTLLFVWSLYYIIIKSINSATPSFYEFTSSLFLLINRQEYPKLYFFLHGFPVYFYFLSLLIFSTYPVRRWYKISAKKAPQIKSYLQ
jgi:hypothetical protein